MSKDKKNSFLHLVLLHLDLEVLGDARLLGRCALRIKHEAHGAVAASFPGLGSLPVGGDRGERVQRGCGSGSGSGSPVSLSISVFWRGAVPAVPGAIGGFGISAVSVFDPVRVPR